MPLKLFLLLSLAGGMAGSSCCRYVHLDGLTKPPAEAVAALNNVQEILQQDGWNEKVMLDQPTMYDCGSSWTILFPYPEGPGKRQLTVLIEKGTGEIKRIKQ